MPASERNRIITGYTAVEVEELLSAVEVAFAHNLGVPEASREDLYSRAESMIVSDSAGDADGGIVREEADLAMDAGYDGGGDGICMEEVEPLGRSKRIRI